MTTSSLERLLDLLRRDLDGVEVRLVDTPLGEGQDGGACLRPLPGGRALDAHIVGARRAPTDPDALPGQRDIPATPAKPVVGTAEMTGGGA